MQFKIRKRLVELRKANGWSQKDVVVELERRFGVVITISYYGMIEQGKRTPKLELAFAIAKLFAAQPNEIFFEEKPNIMLCKPNTA